MPVSDSTVQIKTLLWVDVVDVVEERHCLLVQSKGAVGSPSTLAS